ncbi:mitochondrial pyruvate carrier 2 isoform X3 [Brassica napus]|uniref:mitochondrial pyruvate carrier 2 isoform X3 n=1 Tax=Brassica oleracea var. oleracea TaxID=109376 RepID=UPI0006A6B5EE|nr:PREDICTED: mitochondrial pyruvate carrier 2 isoform X3 [Brassica oleracea var. oleracea]XP_022566125.1 mitochondrial pyruvate carrier 2 isoform X3 [Brassica napus]
MATSKLQALWNHPAGPKTNFQKPPENISYLQQIGIYTHCAVTCTGMIWCRCSTVITPKNWNLFSVNVAMAATGVYQLSRKIKYDYVTEGEAAAENE